jgi:uncharacterized protein (DUF3820 family)
MKKQNIKTKKEIFIESKPFLYAGYNNLMTFGKHKGKLIGEVVENYPEYIVWIADNNIMKIELTILKQCREKVKYHWEDLMGSADCYNSDDWGCRD